MSGSTFVSCPGWPCRFRLWRQGSFSRRDPDAPSGLAPRASNSISIYKSAITARDVSPAPDEAAARIEWVERRYPDPGTLEEEINRWHEV